jgi:asparagine synthase (glutamine-hydrolysing)
MGAVTTHRGPDDEGSYADDRIAFGMRRLSIIDVAGGHQPIANEDESLQVVCNGEIYNFRELRAELEEKGHRFRTKSDAEVIVHLYEEHGDAFVKHLGGMFGFALWDVRRKRLLIGRDRVGIKPIYYREHGGRLAFASEAKAILALPDASAEIDPLALYEYLALGYTPAPFSILRGIKKLPVASMMVCEGGAVRIEPYWSLPEGVDADATEAEWCDRVKDTLERAVVSQMVSDVPLGAFLSGGIDSSAVVAFMARNSSEPIKTYSIGFDTAGGAGSYYNELPFARRVSELFRTDHREIVVRPDVASLLPRLLWHMDEPIADSAFLTTYLIAEFARKDVTVILSGVGGDELFGGYRRYLGPYYDRFARVLPGWLRRGVLAPIARRLPSDRHSPLLNLSRHVRQYVLAQELPFEERYRSYVQAFGAGELAELLRAPPAQPWDALGRAFKASKGADALDRLIRADLLTQLPDDLLLLTDKMTMATSLECRVPILDHEVVELSARMPSRMKIRGRTLKHVLKRALRGLLPDEILFRKKRGFGAPMGAWLKGELAGLIGSVLSRESVEARGLFSWPAVERTLALHAANKADHTDHLLSLMNLEIWCRMTLDGRTPDDVTSQLTAELVS